jgi:hypothetical protein
MIELLLIPTVILGYDYVFQRPKIIKEMETVQKANEVLKTEMVKVNTMAEEASRLLVKYSNWTYALAAGCTTLLGFAVYQYILYRRKEREMEQELDKTSCVICMDEERTVVFTPCFHFACCKSCADTLINQNCPICVRKIESSLNVHRV